MRKSAATSKFRLSHSLGCARGSQNSCQSEEGGDKKASPAVRNGDDSLIKYRQIIITVLVSKNSRPSQVRKANRAAWRSMRLRVSPIGSRMMKEAMHGCTTMILLPHSEICWVLVVLALVVLAGRYTGYRLLELRRFKALAE